MHTTAMPLRSLPPLVQHRNTRTTNLPAKRMDPAYATPAYRAWRMQVVARAGARCEAVDVHGLRCSRAWPEHRMYADHVVELKDGGLLLDLTNGQCLCSSHHRSKTNAALDRRLKAPVTAPRGGRFKSEVGRQE
jgi:5-methylcytosine-specific restriction enzyme A